MKALTVAVALLATGLAVAQPATPAQRAGVPDDRSFGTFHFRTKLGSFRLIDGKGRVEFTFTGSVLLNKVKGRATVTGNVRKEYDKYERQIWTGTGRVIVTGEWRAIQWFGRDMQGVWFGSGIARLQGEFDRDLNTGEYWFEDPTIKLPWINSNTMDVTVPTRRPGVNPNARPRKKG
jgi:hypothetical protein